MKGHVSYERAPLRGYIYNPHFSFVIISSHTILFILIYIYIIYCPYGYLYIPSILDIYIVNRVGSPHWYQSVPPTSILTTVKLNAIRTICNQLIADPYNFEGHITSIITKDRTPPIFLSCTSCCNSPSALH
jgi:hypothetical protein